MDIHRLSRRICAFAFETARRDGRIAEDPKLSQLGVFRFGSDENRNGGGRPSLLGTRVDGFQDFRV